MTFNGSYAGKQAAQLVLFDRRVTKDLPVNRQLFYLSKCAIFF